MRIAYILPSLANKGPILVAKDLCEGIVNKGHKCKVFYFDDIHELTMPCPTERISFKYKIDFSEWDVIHSHMLRPDLWVYMHKSWFCDSSTKFVTTIHQDINQTLISDYGVFIGTVFSKIWKFILKHFNHIVVLTNEQMKSLRGIKQSKISVIFNGRNIDFQKSADKEDAEAVSTFRSKYKILIGTNSIVTKRKGLEQIIKALPLLPDIGYLIVGDGAEKKILEQLAIQLGVEKQCLWLGAKPDGFRYTALFDIYLILSRSEGFPLSLIEAAAWGKPTICSDIPIFRSIVNSDQVVFTPLDHPNLLAQAIKEAIADSQSRGLALHKLYNDTLTAEIMCQNYINLYESLLQPQKESK